MGLSIFFLSLPVSPSCWEGWRCEEAWVPLVEPIEAAMNLEFIDRPFNQLPLSEKVLVSTNEDLKRRVRTGKAVEGRAGNCSFAHPACSKPQRARPVAGKEEDSFSFQQVARDLSQPGRGHWARSSLCLYQSLSSRSSGNQFKAPTLSLELRDVHHPCIGKHCMEVIHSWVRINKQGTII